MTAKAGRDWNRINRQLRRLLRAADRALDSEAAKVIETSVGAPLIITSQAELDAAYGQGFGVFPRAVEPPVIIARRHQ